MGQPKERMDREQRFQEVVAGHGAALWRIARGYAGPSGETEDLYQDILLQIWRILEEFILGLEPIDRSVMLLYAEGLSHDEIGKVTGLSRSAAAVRLHRLKQRFIERYVEA